MAIKTLQSRLTQVGVIRLGQQLVSKNNKKYPAKLETLRFTSPSKPLIDAVAVAYGGEVKPWQAPTGPQFEVITGVKEIAVLVPPQRIDPNLELWGNGFRSRMCDGETETIRNQPCLCEAARVAGQRLKPTDFCKPTTRMSVMLAEIPSLGTWKIESHGWNAAAELPTLAASIESAPQPIPARLEVQVREKKSFDPGADKGKEVESKVFMVPVLHFDWITPAQAFGGELGSAARAALGSAAVERHAIEAGKVESARRKLTAEQYVTLAAEAADIDEYRALWSDAKEDGVLNDAVKSALNARAAVLKKQSEPQSLAKSEPAKPTPAVPDEVVDAEVAPNADEVWSQIQVVAGAKKWSADDLERRVNEHLKKPSDEADGFELTRFFEAVKNGEIA